MPLAISNVLVDHLRQPNPAAGVAQGRNFEETLAQAANQPTQAQRTQMTASAASAELRKAWGRVTGETPDDKTVALLTAQWAHETAHGASMYNYNFGGIKGTGPTGLSVEQHTKEGWGRSERQITDRFRAYESPAAGADDYVRLLTQRFPEAANAARIGDSEGFVHGLKQRGYFTGDAQAYQRSVSRISTGLLRGAFGDNSNAEQPVVGSSASSAANVPRTTNAPASPGSMPPAGNPDVNFIAPLSPSVLLSALSGGSSSANDLHPDEAGNPMGGVSALSMVDEVLRATLHVASSDRNANRRPGNVG